MAINLESLVVDLVANIDDFKGKLGEADKEARGWASGLGGKVGKLAGGAILGVGAAAAGMAAAVGAAAFDVSNDTAQAASDLTALLGTSTEAGRFYAEMARDMFGKNLAPSIDEAAGAIATISQVMRDIPDEAIESVATHAFRLQRAFGVEVSESIDAAQTLMSQFGLTSDEAFDFLAKGFQSGLDRSGDFLDTIGEYSTQFSNVGFDAAEFFSIMETGAEGGVLGTDKIADAIKEMGIILNEGTDGAREAFAAMGLDFDQIAASVSAGDETWADYFDKIIAGLQGIDDPIARSQAQVAIFGTMAEDLGTDFTDAFNVVTQEVEIMGNTVTATSLQLSTSMEDMAGAAENLKPTYQSLGAVTSAIWRRMIVSVSPLTDKLLEIANDAMPVVLGAFDRFDKNVGPVVEQAGQVIDRVVGFVRGLFDQFGQTVDAQGTDKFAYFKGWIDQNMPRIQQIVETVINAISGFWQDHGDAIMYVVNNTITVAFSIIDTALKTLMDAITIALQLLTGDWEGAWETMKGMVERIWGTIQTVIGTQLDSIRAIITDFDWGALGRNIVEGIADGLRNAGGVIADAARQAAQSAYDAARSWLGIHSPSKKAEQDIGEPFAEGIARGIDAGLDSVTRRIATGLTGLMDGIQPSPAAAGAASGGITNYFQIAIGPGATYEDGRRAGRGVLDELRSRGLA